MKGQKMAKRKDKRKGISKMQRLGGSIRQLSQPSEFRIQPQSLPPEIMKLLETLAPSSEQSVVLIQPAASETDDDYQKLTDFVVTLLADLGTGLWRLRQKMVQPGTAEPLDEMRRAFRHLESTWDVLIRAGVEIQDHTGEDVPEGGVYALRAIAYEPTSGLSREQVIETIKPSIYFNKRMIQMGEVVIGTPTP